MLAPFFIAPLALSRSHVRAAGLLLGPPCQQKTFEFHYGKHHQAYVTNLNNQVAGKDLETLSVEEVSKLCR